MRRPLDGKCSTCNKQGSLDYYPRCHDCGVAYQVGYAEGRFDLHTESRAIKKFNDCVAEKKKAPEACWQDQIEWTKVLYRSWDAMTDQQKVDHVAQSNGGIKWADILRGKADSKVMPPLPVEIK